MGNLHESHLVTVENNFSALGDTVCTLPAVCALLKDDALDKVYANSKWCDLYRMVLPKGKVVDMGLLTGPHISYPSKMVVTWVKDITTINMHLVDYSNMRIADALLDGEARNYPSIPAVPLAFDLPKKYVVIVATRTTPMREMLPEAYARCVQVAQQLGYAVVVVGQKYKVHICNGKFMDIDQAFDPVIDASIIDLRERTDLVQLHSVLAHSSAVITVDSGIMHLAGCTEVPIVAGFTCVKPKFRAPIRHGEVGWNLQMVRPTSDCKYCYNQRLMPKQDFGECGTQTFECVKSLTPEKWEVAIRLALEANK